MVKPIYLDFLHRYVTFEKVRPTKKNQGKIRCYSFVGKLLLEASSLIRKWAGIQNVKNDIWEYKEKGHSVIYLKAKDAQSFWQNHHNDDSSCPKNSEQWNNWLSQIARTDLQFKKNIQPAVVSSQLSLSPTNHSLKNSPSSISTDSLPVGRHEKVTPAQTDSANITTNPQNPPNHIQVITSSTTSSVQKVNDVWDSIQIDAPIIGGASGYSVYKGNHQLTPIVIKITPKKEKELLLRVQNPDYVVRVINHAQTEEINKTAIVALGIRPSSHTNVICMEQLKPSDLHSNKKNQFNEYLLEFRDEITDQNDRYFFKPPSHILLSKERIKDILKCSEIIRHLHRNNVFHGDIKQENFGRDSHGAIKIFDFGEAGEKDRMYGTYELEGKQNDIIALGKLFINILTDENVFIVGRHYSSSRLKLDQADLHFVVDVMPIPEELKTILKKMLIISPPYNPATLDEVITDLNRFLDNFPLSDSL